MKRRVLAKFLETRDMRYLNTILTLAEDYLSDAWTATDVATEAYDTLLVDIDSPEGMAEWNALSALACPVIAYSRNRENDASHLLFKPLRPRGPHSVPEILNAISGNLRQIPSSRIAPHADNGAAIDDGYVKRLLDRIEQGVPLRADFAQDGMLLIDPQRKACFLDERSESQLRRILDRADHSGLQAFETSNTDEIYREANRFRLQKKPLERLLWLLDLSHDNATPVGWQLDQKIQLRRWPDLSKLPHQPEHIKLAAALLKRGVSIKTASSRAGISLENAICFANACARLGLIQVVTAQHARSARPSPHPDERVSLLRLVLSSVSRLRAARQ